MAKQKRTGGKSKARTGKRTGRRGAVRRAKGRGTRKTAARKAPAKKAPVKRGSGRKRTVKKTTVKKRTVKKTKSVAASSRSRGRFDSAFEAPMEERGLGLEAGGQAGDTEGLSRAELAASESVEELVEEGQAFEAGVVSGVEDAPDADQGEIRTREVPEDDVPQEYLDED